MKLAASLPKFFDCSATSGDFYAMIFSHIGQSSKLLNSVK
jgi:hypothetical protein